MIPDYVNHTSLILCSRLKFIYIPFAIFIVYDQSYKKYYEL
jgi:hypothetical protein